VYGVPVDTIVATAGAFDQYGTPLRDSYSQVTYSFGKQNHMLYQVESHHHEVMNGKTFDNREKESVASLDFKKQPDSTFEFNPGKMKPVDSLKKVSRIYDPEINTPISVGEPFPNIDAVDMAGKRFSLDQYKGKVVFVYAWTLGVGNTDTDLPKLNELYRKYGAQGFEPVGIAADSVGADSSFLKSKGIAFRNLPYNSELKAKLTIHGYPFAYLIGRDGQVFAKDPWIPDVEPLVKRALAMK
jgi:hypothetical protein